MDRFNDVMSHKIQSIFFHYEEGWCLIKASKMSGGGNVCCAELSLGVRIAPSSVVDSPSPSCPVSLTVAVQLAFDNPRCVLHDHVL